MSDLLLPAAIEEMGDKRKRGKKTYFLRPSSLSEGICIQLLFSLRETSGEPSKPRAIPSLINPADVDANVLISCERDRAVILF